MNDHRNYTPTEAKRQTTLLSQFRLFQKQRIQDKKDGKNQSTSERGLASVGFHNHVLPHQNFSNLLKKVLLSDLPAGYHTRNEGMNALHVACANGNVHVIETLVRTSISMKQPMSIKQRDYKINPRKKTKDNMSLLHFCAISDGDDSNIIDIVLEAMLKTDHEHDGTRPMSGDAVPTMLTSKERLTCEL
mgnify:CR=1 FL=1